MRSRRNRNKTISGIDLTSLMDLTFMLLIVFVITVPVIEYLTDVTPPELDSQTKAENIENPVIIEINDQGIISLDSNNVPMHKLLESLIQLRQQKGQIDIMIRADGSRPYEDVIAIMRTAQKAGLTSVSLMTQAERAGE